MTQRHPHIEASEERSLGQLLAELTQEIMTLVRQEISLAKTEMSAKFANVGANAGMLVAGGALAYAGVFFVVGAIVLLLIQAGLAPWVAALLVGAVVVGAGAFMVMKGLSAIKNADLTPHATLESLKQLKDEVQ